MSTALPLTIAFNDYDRTRPLVSGAVAIEGVAPRYRVLSPEEIFPRAIGSAEFDVCELSLSSHALTVAAGRAHYVGVPVFLSRAFRHNALYVRADRIREPADLRGKRVGLPEYQLTASVWVRALLEDEYGVRTRDVVWVRGGIDQPGRREKTPLALPADIRVEDAPAERTISQLLAEGAIDGYAAPQPPVGAAGHPLIRRLFADPKAAAADYYRRRRIFPIMHLLGVRRSLAAAHPWLPRALHDAFARAKAIAIERLAETGSNKATLPFVEAAVEEARALLGDDYWSYGVEPNRRELEVFLGHHHAQGLSARRLSVDELFHPGLP